MTAKLRQHTLAPNLSDGVSAETAAPGTGVSLKNLALIPRCLRLTLEDFAISVDEADDFGGTKLCDLPDRNILILGCEIDLVATKGGVTNGLEAATDFGIAVGTAVASNATLSGAMVDVVEEAAITADTLTPDCEAHSADNSTSVLPIPLADGASNALYLNVAAAITASDALSIDGTVTVYYLDLGNLSS